MVAAACIKACVLLACIGLWAAQAVAQMPPGVEAAYDIAIDRALIAYEAGDFEQALEHFRRAHELAPSARTLRGLAMAEYELGHYEQCIVDLQAALASREKPLTSELRRSAEALLHEARQHAMPAVLRIRPSNIAAPPPLDPRPVSAPAAAPRVVRSAPAPALVQDDAPANRSTSLWRSPWLWTGLGVVVIAGVTTTALLLGGDDASTATAKPVTTPNMPKGLIVTALR